MRSLILLLVAGCASQTTAPVPVVGHTATPDPAVDAGMVVLAGGCFDMGCPHDHCGSSTLPRREVCLSRYAIDKFEVSVGKYAHCVDAGVCAPTGQSRRCLATRENGHDLPVNCIDWADATTYCKWSGKRLPTEAEWELAGRGKARRKYPWGDEHPSCERVVGQSCGDTSVVEVGSRPAGNTPEGIADLAGSLAEFVSDWYSEPLSWSADQMKVPNPLGPRRGGMRIMKGGSNGNASQQFETLHRQAIRPKSRDLWFLGFRCAKWL